MPGANAIATYRENWEMECDRYQHYFYDSLDTEEDFFKSTAPSEDIWKKFELLPTPPMSPTRTIDAAAVLPPPDKLGWASKLLAQDEDFEECYKIDSKDIFGNLSSIIIQDCMWSGFSASHRLEKVVGERPLIKPLSTQTNSTTAKTANTVADTTVICAPARDCVNPTAVLNIPCNNLKRLASSGSESRADSSDEDDDEDDEDDDEIDVVTVESRPHRTLVPVTITVTGDPHGPGTKRFHVSVHRQQHNYAAPSPDSDHEDPDHDDLDQVDGDHDLDHDDDDDLDLPSRKRPHLEQEHMSSSSSSSSSPSSPSSPHSSDSEEVTVGDRRRNHNFMERKRRKDLRSRFLALRDQIPSLADSSKTPKVVILTQAVEYLLQLHSREHAQAQERRRLRARQQQLLRRLGSLKKGRPTTNT
ncbi:hypothetical protein ACEWY4_005408 [Coilia grayii]|uniref:BHLH domain-containing protein n=1 Tax=Coilia grayii TaxID=363190 RepID=A0ABD1KJ75_9TELE